MTYRHRQHCGAGQREEGTGWMEAGKGRENGDIYNSVSNKNKETIVKKKKGNYPYNKNIYGECRSLLRKT